MTLHVRHSGAWRGAGPFVRHNGAWVVPRVVYARNSGSWVPVAQSVNSVMTQPPTQGAFFGTLTGVTASPVGLLQNLPVGYGLLEYKWEIWGGDGFIIGADNAPGVSVYYDNYGFSTLRCRITDPLVDQYIDGFAEILWA